MKDLLVKADFAFNRLAEKTISYGKRWNRRWLVLLLLAGLFIRLEGAFLYGTQDMEWWKAFGTYATQQSLVGIYGGTDQEIVNLWKQGKLQPTSLEEGLVVLPTQTIIPFIPYQYSRTEYIMPQPPLYIYSIYLSTQLYRLISPELTNNRMFNFFMNLEPIIASAILAWLIARFVSTLVGSSTGQLAGVLYWLNPLVILNAPVQAYRDPLCALFAVLSVVMLYRKNLNWALVFLVLAFMYKPQGILIAPVVVWVGLCEFRLLKNLLAWGIAILSGVVVCLPYILTNHLLGLVQGVLSIVQVSNDLTRQSLNIWWPVQYAANAYVLVSQEGTNVLRALTGRDGGVISDFPVIKFAAMTHVNASTIGFALLGVFTIINLWFVWRRLQSDRKTIIIAAALQVYGYFILRAGVQINHYFILIPLFILLACLSATSLKHYVLICAVFFIQDLIFYGLGRDFNYGRKALSFTYLMWTINLLALANVSLFIVLCWHYYRDAFSASFSTLRTRLPR